MIVGVGFWVLLNKTRFGFDLRATGQSETAAVASGVNPKRMMLISMLLSGGIAGLIWMPALFGGAHYYGTTFQTGLGFTGIAVALLGRNRALPIAFAALLFAFLNAQSNRLTFEAGISASSSRSPRASSSSPSSSRTRWCAATASTRRSATPPRRNDPARRQRRSRYEHRGDDVGGGTPSADRLGRTVVPVAADRGRHRRSSRSSA